MHPGTHYNTGKGQVTSHGGSQAVTQGLELPLRGVSTTRTYPPNVTVSARGSSTTTVGERSVTQGLATTIEGSERNTRRTPEASYQGLHSQDDDDDDERATEEDEPPPQGPISSAERRQIGKHT